MKLLNTLLSLGNQNAKTNYIERLNNVSGFVQKDSYGNLYINRDFSKVKPYVVAHLDTFSESDTDKHVVYDYARKRISADRDGIPCNLGADDGVGVYAGLQLFKKLDIGLAFFRDEEIGCVGSQHANPKWLENASYFIQLDRKGAHDLIFNGRGLIMASDDFINDVSILGRGYGFFPCQGNVTDVVKLSEQHHINVSCVNVSCGYYHPHTVYEYIHPEHMYHAITFIHHVITKLGAKVYPHQGYRRPTYPKLCAFNTLDNDVFKLSPLKSFLYNLAISDEDDQVIEQELIQHMTIHL